MFIRHIDMKGRVYGRLTVLERGPNSSEGKTRWLCQCACGKIKLIRGSSLRDGFTSSCGCLGLENSIVARKRSAKMRRAAS